MQEMRLFLFFVSATIASAQPFTAGIKIGGPVSDAFKILDSQSVTAASGGHFIIGPTAEVHLPFGFGIEVDALHRSVSYAYAGKSYPLRSPVGVLFGAATSAGSWEFPVLAKFRGGLPLLKPYGVAGLSFNHLSGVKQVFTAPFQTLNDVSHSTNAGFVLGGGLEIKVLKLRLSPEIRYTRWGLANFDATNTLGSFLKSTKNQADVLVGITF